MFRYNNRSACPRWPWIWLAFNLTMFSMFQHTRFLSHFVFRNRSWYSLLLLFVIGVAHETEPGFCVPNPQDVLPDYATWGWSLSSEPYMASQISVCEHPFWIIILFPKTYTRLFCRIDCSVVLMYYISLRVLTTCNENCCQFLLFLFFVCSKRLRRRQMYFQQPGK